MMDDDTTTWAARFWAKVERGDDGECWLWRPTAASGNYGKMWVAHRHHQAHRLAWRLLRGEIPDGLHIDHLCRNPRCVNPAHLEPVTSGENARRGQVGICWLDKTHCPKGHPYSGENLLVTNYGGQRERGCKACRRASLKRSSDRRKGAKREYDRIRRASRLTGAAPGRSRQPPRWP